MTHSYRTTRRAALVVGGALLGAHMTMAALSQAPLSPAKLVYGDRVAEYLDPYFSQNWQLFAPTPSPTTVAFSRGPRVPTDR